MLNFELEFPTKLIFGKSSVDKVGKEVAKYGKKVLIHHDGGDYLKELLGKVKGLLEAEGLTVLELGGVVPNPRYSLIQKGVELCRKENVDFVLAIGRRQRYGQLQVHRFLQPRTTVNWPTSPTTRKCPRIACPSAPSSPCPAPAAKSPTTPWWWTTAATP